MILSIAAACAATLSADPSATARPPEPTRPWTLMVYGAADNDADGPILEFLDSVRAALDDDPGMELVLFLDRSEGHSDDASSLGADFTGARVYRLRKDTAELLDAGSHFPGIDEAGEYEVDSADPRNLEQFVLFCKERFPAERYGLMIYGHADGRTMCPDEESGREMAIPELTDVVSEEASVDFLALELCNMGAVEIAYQWRPGNGGFSTDVLLAIPNAGPPLDWDRGFARVRSEGHAGETGAATLDPATLDPATMDAADFARLIVEEGHRGRVATAEAHPEMAGRIAHEAAACFDLRRVEAVKQAVDRLAVALAEAEAKELFEELRGPGPRGTVMNYVGGQFQVMPYVDLYDLCARAASCEELDGASREAATAVCEALDPFVIASFGMPGLEGFQPGRNGVAIVFPDGDASMRLTLGSARVWSRLGWYTPLRGAGEGPRYGGWAFLADGATPDDGEVQNWFELLDCWFDDPSDDPGGANGYVY